MSDPGNVVQISVKVRGRHRKGVLEAPKPACQHRSVLIDEMASEVECETCGAKLSATAWLVEFMDAINRVYLDAAADYRKAKTEYEIKRRCKCQHCGRI